MPTLNKLLIVFWLIIPTTYLSGQIVEISPSGASGDDELTITYDASQGTGGLTGASSVYIHSGVVTTDPHGTDWEYVVGNWGSDDGIGQMTQVAGETDLWEITLTPREYYSVPEGTNIFRLSMVFRSADGTSEGKGSPGDFAGGTVEANGDIFVDLAVDAYVNITSPTQEEVYLTADSPLAITAEASAEVTIMELFVNDELMTSVNSGTSITYDYTPSGSETISITIDATISGIEVTTSKSVVLEIRPDNAVSELPAGIKKGINYSDDETKATLVLEAPGKDFVYVVGDFTNWEVQDAYLMNQTPDEDLFWLEVDGLTPDKDYVFQYWVEGTIRIGDPYADQVADPWNDSYISEEIFPNLPHYDRTEYEIATVLKTGQTPFEWAEIEKSWSPPRQDDLVIYELLVRDFVGSHSYDDLIDSLSYLKRLGVNAIELMPVMEFEGNSSWGYNVSYFFAPDKYYGTKDDFKRFVQAAHEQGFAVILDMVLNHAFGQNAMVRMYWDESAGTVSAESPWFNQVAKHPFNVGFDFNHESAYTKAFVDSVNTYWLQEYHIDGYRFDLSKGFTQVNSGDDVGAWGQYDASRIALLERMADVIWQQDEDAYVILEHFADGQEEDELASQGILLWRNLNHAYATALDGEGGNLSGGQTRQRVSYMESHDEERLTFVMDSEGIASGNYDISNTDVYLERAKMAAAFHLLQSGPKMIWQFGELGYDIPINYNGRTGEKPLVWGTESLGYYEDELRQYVYDAYAAILDLRNEYPEVIRAGSYNSSLNQTIKSIAITHPTLDIFIVGNYGVEEGTADITLPESGDWFDYFSGDAWNFTSTSFELDLAPGQFYIFTSERISEGFESVVEVYQNPVTIDPPVFTASTEITITFDARLASNAGTDGLVGANKVYMHAGVATSDPSSTDLTNIVGNLTDDGVGEMTQVSGESDKWEMTLTPSDYFGLTESDEAFRLGMYFRDADNSNQAKGFRGRDIYVDILQAGNIVSIEPSSFSVNDEITITFNAALGNRALVDAFKVYFHSGVVTSDIETPTGDDWSNAVGNWAADDGVGEMTNVAGTDLWQITITPSSYYGLSGGDAYWLPMVFRDATGANKGSGPASEFEGGFIATNGDIFMRIPLRPSVLQTPTKGSELLIYPNPSKGLVRLRGLENDQIIRIFDQSGKLVLQDKTQQKEFLDCSTLPNGLYLLKAEDGNSSTLKLLISK